MMRLVILISVLIAAIFSASADKTTRRNLRPIPAEEATEAAVIISDTIPALGGELQFSGYDKPLNSRKETFLITNMTADTVTSVTVTINYLDMKGRQLNSATSTVDLTIPPGETRQAVKPSWDIQQSFYYYLGKKPRTSGVAPYKVKITPLSFTIPHRTCPK